ncbi:MAG: hypothetical protein K2M04_03380 [Muribaculaceae bacterium]|nr:hypothetical protein [Muribaculaceae bacterium]
MKIDFEQIQNLASQLPEIISKGQQVVSSVNAIMEAVKPSNNAKAPATDKAQIESIVENEIEEVAQENTSSEDVDLASMASTLNTPVAVASTIKEMVQQANETIRFCEEQETARTEIRANAAVEITKINAMADLVRDYLKRSFDERAVLFDNYFTVLDKALEKGDNTLVAQTLQSINSLAASSPFKDLTDINKVASKLSEGGEWDI